MNGRASTPTAIPGRRPQMLRFGAWLGAASLLGALLACGLGGGQEVAEEDFCQRASSVILDFGQGEMDMAVAADTLDVLAGDAPDEIRADLALLADASREMGEALEAGSSPSYDEAEVDAAGDRVDRYLAEECGLTDLVDNVSEFESAGDDLPAGDDPDQDAADPGALGEDRYLMSASGAFEFEHRGEVYCSLIGGEFYLEFYDDDDPDLGYDGYAVMEKVVPGTYQGEFAFYTPDEDVAIGPATITITSVDPMQDDLVSVAGEIEGEYEGEVLGSGSVTGSWRCVMLAEEAEGAY